MKKVREEVFKHHPKIRTWEKVVLVLPVLLSGAWMFYLQYGQKAYYGIELLSPTNTTPLMIALIIFTIGYIIFLLMMFSENLQEMIMRLIKH